MKDVVILLVIFLALGVFIVIATGVWNRKGRLEAHAPDEITAADPYAKVEAVGRDEAELERDNDPVRSLEDADGGGYAPEDFGATAQGDGLI